MEKFYKQKIMRHFTSASTQSLLQNARSCFVGQNPVCGDSLKLTLRIDSDGKVLMLVGMEVGVLFQQASASIFHK